jgi:hypothetical protein
LSDGLDVDGVHTDAAVFASTSTTAAEIVASV